MNPSSHEGGVEKRSLLLASCSDVMLEGKRTRLDFVLGAPTTVLGDCEPTLFCFTLDSASP